MLRIYLDDLDEHIKLECGYVDNFVDKYVDRIMDLKVCGENAENTGESGMMRIELNNC